jgi:hypothetical protein
MSAVQDLQAAPDPLGGFGSKLGPDGPRADGMSKLAFLHYYPDLAARVVEMLEMLKRRSRFEPHVVARIDRLLEFWRAVE